MVVLFEGGKGGRAERAATRGRRQGGREGGRERVYNIETQKEIQNRLVGRTDV